MILVTGAAGFIGRHVVAELARQRREVRALVHHPDEAKGLAGAWDPLVEIVRGDVRDANSLLDACRGADAVIHLVSVLKETPGATYETVNVLGTRNVIAAARERGATRFVHISTLGANPRSRYRFTRSIGLAEEDVRQGRLEWTIVRPSFVFGIGSKFFAELERMVRRSPVVPIIGRGRTRFQPIWVEDLARCLAMAIDDETLVGRSVDLGGPQYVSFEEMVDAVMDAAGVQRPKIHIPALPVVMGASLLDHLWSTAPLPFGQVGLLTEEHIADLDVVEREFGFKPAPLGAHIAQMVAVD